jgi:hypothetical protein
MRYRLALFSIVVLSSLSDAVAQAQRPVMPALMSQLDGAWRGSGTILGQPSRVEMQWQPALDGRFVRLTFVSHIGPEPRSQRFEGHAYYQATAEGGRLRASWFDSSGLVRPVEAVATTDTLVATWGTPETEVGETTYRLVTANEMDVVDRVRGQNGVWREFGRSRLSRTSPK